MQISLLQKDMFWQLKVFDKDFFFKFKTTYEEKFYGDEFNLIGNLVYFNKKNFYMHFKDLKKLKFKGL